MRALIFGATGMIGQGVLRECLRDPSITAVRTIGRSPSPLQHGKLTEIVRADLFHYEDIAAQITGFDACFFCLGVSSSQVNAAEYERLTYTLTLAAAEALARLNPEMAFVFVSGTGADSSEQGRVGWARVKGKTENAVLRLPFRAAFVVRPAMIEPAHGEQSRTPVYRVLYKVLKPLLPLLRRLFPNYAATTAELGRAMIYVAQRGAAKRVLESADIRACVELATASDVA